MEPTLVDRINDVRAAHGLAPDFPDGVLYANLRGADLSRANLDQAVLVGASLVGANLSGASIRGTDLREAYMRGDLETARTGATG